jgi:hypothetical protein
MITARGWYKTPVTFFRNVRLNDSMIDWIDDHEPYKDQGNTCIATIYLGDGFNGPSNIFYVSSWSQVKEPKKPASKPQQVKPKKVTKNAGKRINGAAKPVST